MKKDTKRIHERAVFARKIRQLDERDERDELELDDFVPGQIRGSTPITTLHRFDSAKPRTVSHAN